MEKLKSRWLAIAVLLTFFGASPRPCAASEIRLTLVIYDHAHLSDGKLADVESITSEIFRRVGVQVVWVEGFAYAAQRRGVFDPRPQDPPTPVVTLTPRSRGVP